MRYYVRKFAQRMDRHIETIPKETIQVLTEWSWPGNVRELENEIKRAVVLSLGQKIEADDLSESIREERLVSTDTSSSGSRTPDGKPQSIKNRVTSLEIQMIRDAMSQAANDKRRAAKMLGLSHQGLLNKLKRYGLGQ